MVTIHNSSVMVVGFKVEAIRDEVQLAKILGQGIKSAESLCGFSDTIFRKVSSKADFADETRIYVQIKQKYDIISTYFRFIRSAEDLV